MSLLLAIFVLISINASEALNSPKTILFISCYQKSPIISMQGLAEEMKERGYRVLFAVTDDDRNLISESVGVEFISAGPPVKDTILILLDAPTAHGIDDLWTGEELYARSMYDILLANIKSQNITIDLIAFEPLSIVAEVMITIDKLALALKLGVKSVQVSPHLSTLTWLGSEFTSQHPVIISGLTASKMALLEKLKNSAMMVVSKYILPFLRGTIQNKFRHDMGLPEQWFECQNEYGKTKLVLLGVTPGFEPPRAYSPMVQLTGPWLPRDTPVKSGEERVREFVKRQGLPLLFVSIGTNSDHTVDSANAILGAIIEGVSNKRFRVVWSLKEKHRKLLHQVELEKALTTNELKQDILIVDFAPQLVVLNYSSIFMSHCGLASAQESIYYGVPLICVPMMLVSDQPTIAARVEELGLGVWLDRREKELTKYTILDNVNKLLSNNNPIKTEVARWSNILHKLDGRKIAGDWLEVAILNNIDQILQPLPDYNIDVWIVFTIMIYFIYSLFKSVISFLYNCCCGVSEEEEMQKKSVEDVNKHLESMKKQINSSSTPNSQNNQNTKNNNNNNNNKNKNNNGNNNKNSNNKNNNQQKQKQQQKKQS